MLYRTSPSSRRAWIEIRWPLRWCPKRSSPSSRRAWIEIIIYQRHQRYILVALLAEGVDRNLDEMVEPLQKEVSPSSRRAWIEMFIMFMYSV